MTLLARGGVSIGDAPEIDSDDEYEAERDRNAKDSGIVGNLQEQIRTEFDKGMLELRLQLVRMRTEYLNNINTQAMLLGSIAVAMLSQSELISFDDTIETWWSLICGALYTLCAGICLSTSMWVIYTAMNLINLSIHSTLYGLSMAALAEADNIIELRLNEVRHTFILSLVTLFIAAFASIAEGAPFRLTCVGFVIFAGVAWHASASDAGTVRIYERFTGLKVADRFNGIDSLLELAIPFGYEHHAPTRRYIKLHEKAETVTNMLIRRGFSRRANGRKRDIETSLNMSASRIEKAFRMFRARKLQGSSDACLGWMLKTGSGNGPLDKLREAIATSGVPADEATTTVQDLPPGEPNFPKFFVLNEKRKLLQIFGTDEEFFEGQRARFTIDSVRACAVLRLPGNDGRSTLALLPGAILKDPALLMAQPPSPSSMGSAADKAGLSDGFAGGLSKGWYLRAADEAQTQMWFGRLKVAGARMEFDHKLAKRGSTRRWSAVPANKNDSRQASRKGGAGGGWMA